MPAEQAPPEPVRRLPTQDLVGELQAIEVVWGILEALHPAQRGRVLAWMLGFFTSDFTPAAPNPPAPPCQGGLAL